MSLLVRPRSLELLRRLFKRSSRLDLRYPSHPHRVWIDHGHALENLRLLYHSTCFRGKYSQCSTNPLHGRFTPRQRLLLEKKRRYRIRLAHRILHRYHRRFHVSNETSRRPPRPKSKNRLE